VNARPLARARTEDGGCPEDLVVCVEHELTEAHEIQRVMLTGSRYLLLPSSLADVDLEQKREVLSAKRNTLENLDAAQKDNSQMRPLQSLRQRMG
jgi:hypothetical protein